MRRICLFTLLLGASVVCTAQDASLLGGRLNVTGSHEHSFGVELGYAYRLGDFFSLSAEYLNEGHPSFHHRDGLAGQLWLHTPVPPKGWEVAYGIGPYSFFDTTTGNGSAVDYRNIHGRGYVTSLSVRYHLEERSYVEMRANRVRTRGEGDSTMVLVGMGYELRNLPEDVRLRNADAGDQAITVQVGQAIVNSFESERARAFAVEYRKTVTPNIEWSVAGLNEGRIGLVERRGVDAQGWLLAPLSERWILELGIGPYLMRDQINRNDAREDPKWHLVPIASIGMRYRISPNWRTQLSWSRVVTDYHRDSDVLLMGVGKTF